MIKAIRRLLGLPPLCEHKRELHERISEYENSWDSMPDGFSYVLRCEKCGNMKIVKTN